MLKFNNLVNKIIVECSDSNIISEDVTVNDIRDMIKQMDKSKAERLRRYFFDDFTYIFYTAESRLRENKLNDIDKIIINDIETTIVDKNEFIRNLDDLKYQAQKYATKAKEQEQLMKIQGQDYNTEACEKMSNYLCDSIQAKIAILKQINQ